MVQRGKESMSRTDKDAPWWVRSEYYTPSHYYCEFDYNRWYGWHKFPDGPRVCDLPPEPFRHRHRDWVIHRRGPTCMWESEWPWKRRYSCTHAPTREDRHLGWYGPDRRRARDLMIEAGKEYRGYREVDVIEPTWHHRHASIKGWWD